MHINGPAFYIMLTPSSPSRLLYRDHLACLYGTSGATGIKWHYPTWHGLKMNFCFIISSSALLKIYFIVKLFKYHWNLNLSMHLISSLSIILKSHTFYILNMQANIAHTQVSTLSVWRMKNLDTLPPAWPMSTLILDHHVASVLSGETDRGLCGQSCLNSGTPNQSSPSLSVSPSVFLIAHSPSPHSDGGHVWSRAENGQSGSSRTHYYHCSSCLSLSLFLPALYSAAILPFSLCLYLPFTVLSS